jgi:hypothetical protein
VALHDLVTGKSFPRLADALRQSAERFGCLQHHDQQADKLRTLLLDSRVLADEQLNERT